MRLLQWFTVVLLCCFVISLADMAEAQSLTITPYGYLKLDMAYDQARTNNGNFMMWLDPAAEEDDEFNLTVRQTRLGALFAVDRGLEVTGQFEMDFYGDAVSPDMGGMENKNMPMLRHAFMKVNFGRWYLLAGQTWDVISPLIPNTLNYSVLWNQGNIGFRVPQLRVGTTIRRFELIGALTRNIPGDSDGDGNDDGEDSGMPALQASVSYRTDCLNIGVSGNYATGEYKNVRLEDDTYTTSSFNVHASWQLTERLRVQGEAFSGQNLAQHFGGISQNFRGLMDVKTVGGWADATVTVRDGNTITLGASMDDPDEDSVNAFPTRIFNSTVYANMFCTIAPHTQFSTEVSYLTTKFFTNLGAEDEISGVRLHSALIFTF